MTAIIEWVKNPSTYTWCNACDAVVDHVESKTGYCTDCFAQVSA